MCIWGWIIYLHLLQSSVLGDIQADIKQNQMTDFTPTLDKTETSKRMSPRARCARGPHAVP